VSGCLRAREVDNQPVADILLHDSFEGFVDLVGAVAVSKDVLFHVFDVVLLGLNLFQAGQQYPTSRTSLLAGACST
jgi:hypothetical protein